MTFRTLLRQLFGRPRRHLVNHVWEQCSEFVPGDAVHIIGKTYTGKQFGDDFKYCPTCGVRNNPPRK